MSRGSESVRVPIAFVVENNAELPRLIQILSRKFDVDVFSSQSSEEALMVEFSRKTYALILAPADCYLRWSRVEAHYGITRTSGPTFAGYFTAPLISTGSRRASSAHRVILMDFTQDLPERHAHWIGVLAKDSNRAGMSPLFLNKPPPFYSENWMAQEEQDSRFEQLLRLPEIAESHWKSLANAMRVCLGAVWGWVYDEGAAVVSSAPKVFFQFAANSDLLVFRFLLSCQGLKPTQVVESFWPGNHAPDSFPVLLATHADVVRVHPFAESPFVELTLGFFPKTTRQISRGMCRNFWVEPLDPALLQEPQFVASENLSRYPQLRAFPFNSVSNAKVQQTRILQTQVQGLIQKLSEREALIRELRSGGVGTPTQLPPPDAVGLLEAFRGHYFQIENELRGLEVELQELQKSAPNSREVSHFEHKILALTQKEELLLHCLAETMNTLHQRFRKHG
ncbi:hypothetical protein WDW86_03920 [Bdellovibrionota bacterium FG-2]